MGLGLAATSAWDGRHVRFAQARRSLYTFSAAVVLACASCALPLLPRVGFKILARAPELRESVLEVVGQQSHAEKILPGRGFAPLARLGDGASPLVRLEIASSDPGERDQCGGFVDIQVPDELDELPRIEWPAASLNMTRSPSSVGLEGSGPTPTSSPSNSRDFSMTKQTFAGLISGIGCSDTSIFRMSGRSSLARQAPLRLTRLATNQLKRGKPGPRLKMGVAKDTRTLGWIDKFFS